MHGAAYLEQNLDWYVKPAALGYKVKDKNRFKDKKEDEKRLVR